MENRHKLINLADKMLSNISEEELKIIKFFKPIIIAFLSNPLKCCEETSYKRIESEETLELCDEFLKLTSTDLFEKLRFLREMDSGIDLCSDHTMAYPFYSMIKLKSEYNFTDVANLMHENTHMMIEWKVYPRILQELAPIIVETLSLQFLKDKGIESELIMPLRIRRANEEINYIYSVITMIEMIEASGNYNSESKNNSIENIEIPKNINEEAFFKGLEELEKVLNDRNFIKNKSLNLNHFIGTIIGVYLAERIKNKELNLDYVFSVLTNFKIDYINKLNSLGMSQDNMAALISNIYNYSESNLDECLYIKTLTTL